MAASPRADGDPIGTPPLLANPIGGASSFLGSTSGFVTGFSTHSAAPDFVPLDTGVLIHDLHYHLEFFTDATQTTPLALELASFTSVQARLDSTDIVIAEATTVPEPAALGLFGAGLAALGWLGGRRRRSG